MAVHAQAFALPTTELHLILDVEAGVTDNVAGAPSSERRPDEVTSIRPAVTLATRSRFLKLDAHVGADAVVYARGLQPDRVLPVVSIDGTAEAVERLLFIDASVGAHGIERDPYGARSSLVSTQNQEVVSVYRLSPHLERDIGNGLSTHARFEEIVSHTDDDSDAANNQRFRNIDASLTRKPTPVGGSISIESHEIHYSAPADSSWKIETLKATGDLALGGELVVGPVVGTERTTLQFDSRHDGLYGAHLAWVPSERTHLSVEAEHRFFGTGWLMDFRHRTPWLTFSVQWTRAPVTSSESLGVVGAGQTLTSFLDAILTTRYPDPDARAAIVNGIVASRGTQGAQASPIDVRADYVQLQNRLSANAVFLGGRNMITAGVYMLTLRGLDTPADALQGVLGDSDSRQSGASLDFNRKLEAQLTLDFNATWSRIAGLISGSAQSSTDQSYRLSLVRRLSPHTSVAAGLRHETLRTNPSTLNSYEATSAFVGMTHQF